MGLDRFFRGFFRRGQIEITWANGTTTLYGDRTGPLMRAELTTESVEKALLLNPDLGIGEGFTSGEFQIENDDLDAFFQLVLTNRALGGSRLFRVIQNLRRIKRSLLLRNPIGRARSNVAHHYDLSAKLYELFLDADRQYSCAYFSDPDMTLDAAQLAKKRHIARKLCLQPGMQVLDIGCGWGGMALTLAQEFDVHVVGVTLSDEQYTSANARVLEAGLADKIDIRLQDYREVPEQFDRIVSVGMLEHVGPRNYGEYFTRLDRLLNAEGVALIHTISTTSPPRVTSPWITKYIFPGGHIPALSEIAPYFEGTALRLTDLEVWRLHYAETLKHWYDRFMEHAAEAEALYDAQFVRMWRYYLKASEMTFRHDQQVVIQMQFSRTLSTVPLTLD